MRPSDIARRVGLVGMAQLLVGVVVWGHMWVGLV